MILFYDNYFDLSSFITIFFAARNCKIPRRFFHYYAPMPRGGLSTQSSALRSHSVEMTATMGRVICPARKKPRFGETSRTFQNNKRRKQNHAFALARPNLRIPAPRRGECLRFYNMRALKNRRQRARSPQISKYPPLMLNTLGEFAGR